jgi:OFA family oxalate/formate antiporter-like MFS transporter
MNKLRIILGACGIHLCIGSVYAWSVLTNPIIQYTNWSLSSVTFTFSLAILFLGFSAAFLGNSVQLWGPKKSAAVSFLFFFTGLVGSAFAVYFQNIYLLYLFYGCIGGIGLGVGYIAPVATLLKWFPNAKGFAGGCAVMSFGFSAMISGPVMQTFVEKFGIVNNFLIMAAIYGVIMNLSIFLIQEAPPMNSREKLSATGNAIEFCYKPDAAVKTKDFWILWFVFFINISCGIALLSIASLILGDVLMAKVDPRISFSGGGGRK